uniref:Putative secreted metalloprotease n=1 Tax=Ixodes ricinus TaxID=34613 RepID=A0A6B0VCE3_IXORI
MFAFTVIWILSLRGICPSSLRSSRSPLLLLLFIFIPRIPNAEMCQSHTKPVPTKPPSVPSQRRHINLFLLSDYSHCQLFNNTGDQRLYMTVMANGVRATYSGLPHGLRLAVRLVGISCLSKSEQDRMYKTSIDKRDKLDGNSALWGLKIFASQNKTEFENATVIAMLTAYYFQEESKTGYSSFAGFCRITDQVALISDPHALYRIQEELAEHILRIMGVNLEEGLLKKCVRNQTDPQQCSLEKLNASLARMPQDCFRPRGQEVPQVTSLPGDVVDLPKLCKAMYSHIEKIEHCFEHEDTGMHRFFPVYKCELTCCVWKSSLDRKLHEDAAIQGLRCGVRNQICVNGDCYNREDWIKEHLPCGSVDIRPDVPRKKPF